MKKTNASAGELRVLRVVTRLNVGGPARQILALQPQMARRGVSSLLVAGSVEDGEADLAELAGFHEVLRLPQLTRSVTPTGDLAAVAKLVRVVRRFRPHVIHTHMAKAGAIGRVAAMLCRTPVRVHTYHGHTMQGYFSPRRTGHVVAAERFLARTSSALVAVSDSVAADLMAAGIGDPASFHVIPPGLDLAEFLAIGPRTDDSMRDLDLRPGEVVIGFAARLVPVKAVDVFLEAARRVLRSAPHASVLIAGDGPDMERVRQAQSDPEVGDRIRTAGWVNPMTRFYSSVDLVALSSRNEGTPISLIEAAAAGKPVIATRVGGVAAVVRQGETGLLVPRENPAALAEGMLSLVLSPAIRSRMGRAGRSHALRFSADRLAGDLLDLYRSLLPGRNDVVRVPEQANRLTEPAEKQRR
jgi:glycosyltransferase involved in cell wall biosynthesis